MGLVRLVVNMFHAKMWHGESSRSSYTRHAKLKYVFYPLSHANNSYDLEKTFIGSHVTDIGPFYVPSVMLLLVKIRPIMYCR